MYTHTHTRARTGYALGRVSRKTERRDGGYYTRIHIYIRALYTLQEYNIVYYYYCYPECPPRMIIYNVLQ